VNLRDLAKPFPVDAVSWRVGSTNAAKTSGMALAYIDARDVMDRLDEVCGPENWRDEYTELSGFVLCKLWIRVGGEWVWKCDGAGKTDVEGEKGMVSDAFKRAAVKWGIGRYLYSLDSPWVDIEARGRSYVIAESGKARLRGVLTRQAGTAQAVAPVSPPQPKQEEPTKQNVNAPTPAAASVPAPAVKPRIADMIPEVPPTQHPVPGVGQFAQEEPEWKVREKKVRSKREADKAIKALNAIKDDIGAAEPAHINARYAKWVTDTKKIEGQFVGDDVGRVATAVREFKAANEAPAHDEDGVILEQSE
jgi:hypothetical protein